MLDDQLVGLDTQLPYFLYQIQIEGGGGGGERDFSLRGFSNKIRRMGLVVVTV